MATGPVNAANLLRGPGILFWGNLGSTAPTNTVTAGVFSDAVADWTTGGFSVLGATEEGSTFSDSVAVDPVEVAESYYAVQFVSTGREATWSTALAEINKTTLKAALNGGTSTTTGTGATSLTTIEPPTVGSEIRGMIGWQSEDNTVRFIGRRVLNAGSLDLAFRKGADKATLSIEWRLEKPSAAEPWVMYLAGEERAK